MNQTFYGVDIILLPEEERGSELHNQGKVIEINGLNSGASFYKIGQMDFYKNVMKRFALVFGIVFISLLVFSQGIWAQRIYRDDPRAANPFTFLNLTQEQMEKIDKLDLELDNELSPMFSKLKSAYFDLEELEYQRNPDQTAIDKKWAAIQNLETEIQNREALYDEKIRSLLTAEQQKLLDSYYYPPRQDLYRRGGLGQGYYGRGGRGYGRNRTPYGVGSDVGRGAGRLGAGYYNNYSTLRLGRGPCGAGLGRWYRWDYRRSRRY